MFAEIKRKILWTSVKRAIVLLLVATVLLLLGGREIFKVLIGPSEIDGVSIEALNGKYVRADISYVVDYYTYLEETKSGTPTGEGDIVNVDYMFALPDSDTLWGVRIKERDLDAFLEEYNAYDEQFLDATITYDNLAIPFPSVSGTVIPMTHQIEGFFDEVLDMYSIPHEYGAYYVLVKDVVGDTPINTVYILGGIAGLCVLFALLLVLRALLGGGQKSVKNYINTVGGYDAEIQLEEWYAKSEKFGNLRTGPGFLLTQHKTSVTLIPKDEVVWAYQSTTRVNGVPSHSLAIGKMDGKIEQIAMKSSDINKAVFYIRENFPDAALGYTDEIAAEFKRDPLLLRSYAAAQRQQESSSGVDNDGYDTIYNS